jgi:ATP-dependent Zn protease
MDVFFQALLRPGRFDRHILIDLPTAKERQELFEMYLAKITTDFSISEYAPRLAHLTPGMSGKNLCIDNFNTFKIITRRMLGKNHYV